MSQIPADLRVPLFYAEMDNSQANSGATQLRRLLIGLVNDDVTAPTELVLAATSSEVAALAGAGSVLHDMHVAHRRNDPMGETWVLPVKIEAGAKASGTISFTGSATASGVVSVYVGNVRVTAAVSSGQAAADVGEAVAQAVNAAVLPATAVSAEGVVTVTAKFSGLLGNDLRLGINLRGSAGGEHLPTGLGVTVTAMTGGAGTPDLDAALAVVGDEPFEFITHPFSDSASLESLRSVMDDTTGRWSWLRMLYGHVYSARRGTLGELVAFGRGGTNDQHGTVAALEPLSPTPVWKFAAEYGARTAVFISADPARPTQTGALSGVMPAPEGQRFGILESNSLLWAGVATSYYEGGYVRIGRAVTLYLQNTFGQPDDSYLDSETMHQSAAILRRLQSLITSKFARHKLANDGTRFGAGQAIVTPKTIRNELIAEYSRMEREGLVENTDVFARYLIVERDEGNPNRVNVLFPPDYVNQLRIVAVRNEFRLQYPVAA
ncbi:phage tail sheath subtilisin-like domain-containing protein [Paracandidimonas soli]|nr:phage tail sheath subtilisin-like domain-containing protein [Paracandidimonas soli]